MTPTTRAGFAAFLFVAIVAGTLAPRMASAHRQLTLDERSITDLIHPPEAPRNLRVRNGPQVESGSRPGRFLHSVTVSWDPGHYHAENTTQPPIYQIYLLKSPAGTTSPVRRNTPDPEGPEGRCTREARRSGECFIYTAGSDTAATVPGVEPETTYYAYVKLEWNYFGPRHYATATITTSSDTETPTEPETPSEPETPTDPETPEPPGPVAQTCTYEHRLIGVPGTTANAYNGRILVSSKMPNATATIRAYQADNGHRIDVLNAAGHAVETVSLAPAHSVKRFSIEAIRGWHPVIVEHPSASAMQAATVAMRIREPGGSVEDSYPPGIAQCQPATGTGTPAPDLAVRDAQALLWPNTLDWRATVENIGTANAPPTTIRMYYGDSGRPIASTAVHQEVAAGSQWPMSSAIARSHRDDIPPVGATVRICVDAVPGEPASKRANNCTSATVERN